jgi:selenocysteine lyase/cysteine desulfurase
MPLRPTQLYLDTARLGRMSRRSQQAHLDFARLAGEEGGSLFFETFLRAGAGDWTGETQARYPGLASWRGVGGLKESLRTLAGSSPGLPVLLANRSAQLMKLAARLLYHPCENVLVTDLGWLPYHDVLAAEAARAGAALTSVPVRDGVLHGQAGEDDIVETVRAHYLRERCDGLLLTSVSHQGVRLPVERIVRSLEAMAEPRFVVIDGSQEFCHVAADLQHEYCDLYLAGCHKWLQAYHPMGLAFYGRRRSRSMIETVLGHFLGTGELDDPLLRFSAQLEGNCLDGRTETVNLACLFSGQGAVADALEEPRVPSRCLPRRLESLSAAAGVAAASGWQPVLPPPALRTGILLLQSERKTRRELPATDLRHAFSERGVALTAYEGGVVRLSMPAQGWQPGELELLQGALQAAS